MAIQIAIVLINNLAYLSRLPLYIKELNMSDVEVRVPDLSQ